jgi:anti-anti-sigma factor
LQFTKSQHGSTVVYTLKGHLAVVGTAELERDIVQAIAGGARRLIFDMTDMDYISSAGLRVLIVAMKKLGEGEPITLCGLQPTVQQIFDISGLTALVRLAPTTAEALAQG